jgi:phage repressor protein C with HTH and peptisase S24 domain
MNHETPVITRNLSWYLKRTGLSNREFARHIGVSATTADQWLSGKYKPKATYRTSIARLMGISERELLTVDFGLQNSELPQHTEPSATPAELGNVIYVDLPVSGGPLDGHYYKEAETTLLAVPGWSGEGYAFTVYGDSMSPVVNDGDIVVCKLKEDKAFVQGELYMIETRNDGMTCKYIKSLSGQLLEIYGANPRYKPYTLQASAVARIYEVKGMYRPLQRP